MTGRNSLHYCYDVSYQCWFASEEAKIYCNNFNSSNAVVCSHLILAYTVRLAMINAAELERNGCFSLPLLRNVVLWLKRTSTKSLQIELVTKYDTNNVQKESLVGESKSAKGGPYPPLLLSFHWDVIVLYSKFSVKFPHSPILNYAFSSWIE